jgi:hypothetical protein
MNQEIKTCQNCRNDFTIEPDDFSFYEKIKVPPPTFCPECRMIRRMLWRNIRSLYKRECGLCKKSLISMYSDNAPVYCNDCWYGDKWDPFSYGKEYDFSKLFFIQLKELFNLIPRFYSYKFGNLTNSDFTNYSVDNKNAYLSYSVVGCEDVMYSENIDDSKNSFDCFSVKKLDGCSYNVDCRGNYNTHYAVKSSNCIDSYFIYDCINCQNCCLSYNLRNQQYIFRNQKFSKEEYKNKIKGLKQENYSGFQDLKKKFNNFIQEKAIHKYAFIHASQNVTGNYIHNAKNTKQCFDVYDTENVKYCTRAFITKENYDTQGSSLNSEFIYESNAASRNTYKDFFCYITIEGCRECQYSLLLKNCSNCFGCIGLTNAQYCILNKQYSKKEYFEMVEKIKKHMINMPYVDEKGRIYKYGEFFPYDMCPFGYNETSAQEYFPLIKEEVIKKGYLWKNRGKRDYQITKDSSELPDNISDVNDDILNEIIGCPNNGNQDFQCSTAYRIMPDELQFYRQKNLPLPRYCPNCRHYQRLKYRNPFKLWRRQCMCDKQNHNHEGKCEVKFETSYSPDRPEIIYCERCYQQEVY